TADEACELVLQAAAIGGPGETLVLDMGEPIRIDDLAKRVIALSGRTDAKIVYTGLRPGEKLTEALLSPGEVDDRPNHPLITQVPITPIELEALKTLVAESRDPQVFTHREALDARLTRILDSGQGPTGVAEVASVAEAPAIAGSTEPDAESQDTGAGH